MAGRASSPVLIGRDDAVTRLTAAFDASAAGAPRFVIVRGEAGIGKSRLVAEATRLAAERETLLLVGRCLDIGAVSLPYLSLADALRGLARTIAPDTLELVLGPGRRDLAAVVPELGAGAGPSAETVADAGSTTAAAADPDEAEVVVLPTGLGQARLFERVLGVLGALSTLGRTVLVVEDVHWIDRATRDLLTFLSRNLTDERLSIVLTMRVDDLPRGHPILTWLADLERLPSTVVVDLDRLDRASVERQLRVIAGDEPDPGLADRIWRRSQGNPLFVEELLAAAGSDEDSPRTIVEILLGRVVGLGPEAREVVDAAAVAGRPVDERLIADVLERPEREVDPGLRTALANRVLELEPTTERYRFRHELLREVVEQELLPGERRRLHEQFARRLEARPELADTSPVGAAGELAHHYAQAGLVAEAYGRSIGAARASEAVFAYADAWVHLERALDLEPRLPPGTDDAAARLSLRRRAADAADLANDAPRAMELIQQALAMVDADEDPVTAALVHSRIGYLQWRLGDSTMALDAHREAVRLLPAEPPTPERARVLASLGGALMGAGRWAESRAICEAAIETARASGARTEESRARNMLGSDLVALGEIDAGIDQLREARRIAQETGPVDILIVCHFNLALNLSIADGLAEGLAEAQAGRAVAREGGLERRFGQDLAALQGDILLRLGRTHETDRVLAEGLALDPSGVGAVYLSAVRARLAAIRGDGEEADRRLRAIDLEALDPDTAAYVAAVAAEAYAWARRPGAALDAAEAGLRRLEGLDDVLWAPPLVALGLHAAAELAEAGRVRRDAAVMDEVVVRAGRLQAQLDRLAGRVSTFGGRGFVATSRGELARVEGRDDPPAWLDAIAAFDAVPDPLDAAYARYRAAEAALRLEGVKADVGDLVREAARVAEAAGARPLGEAVARLAARARIPMTPATSEGEPSPDAAAEAGLVAVPADPHAAAISLGLSAREIEVLELVVGGLSNGEIADRLFISRKTASVHVTHILDKLGVSNRVGAAMVGARIGMSGTPADDELAGVDRA